MGSPLQLEGKQFGRLLVKERSIKIKNNYTWICVCSCGNTTVVPGRSLMYGTTKSCGCLQRESAKALYKEDAVVRHPLYSIYNNIKKRCYNKNCAAYKNYGGRGITMSDSWLNSFEQFIQDIGERPDSTSTIERLDNNGNYCKENVRWASKAAQSRNQRKYTNNTSGVTGVNLMNRNTNNPCWMARVSHPITHKDITKSFSINNLGNDEAFRLACEYRERLIQLLNKEFNAGYSETHGQ